MEKAIKKTGKSSEGESMHYSVGVIIEHDGEFLLLDRVNPPYGFAGPAGHINEGENQETAIKREAFEETGIELKNFKMVGQEEIFWNRCKDKTNVHYWYLFRAKVDSDFFKMSTEAKSMAWYTKEEIEKLNLEPVWKYWFEKFKFFEPSSELKEEIRIK